MTTTQSPERSPTISHPDQTQGCSLVDADSLRDLTDAQLLVCERECAEMLAITHAHEWFHALALAFVEIRNRNLLIGGK